MEHTTERPLYPLSAAARVRRHHHAEVMLNVVIALVPTLIASFVFRLAGAAGYRRDHTAACVLFSTYSCLLRKTPQTAGDLSAVVTGLAAGLQPTLHHPAVHGR